MSTYDAGGNSNGNHIEDRQRNFHGRREEATLVEVEPENAAETDYVMLVCKIQ